MRTLYCKSDLSFIDLLRPMFSELNDMYWVAMTQTRWLRYDWIGSPREVEIFDHWCLPVPAFQGKDLSLWRPGALSALDGNLAFDEWSYFIGFQAAEAEAIDRATQFGFSKFFSPEFYELLKRDGQLFAVYVDGWWEFSPATGDLFARITECAQCREMAPRTADQADRTPQFV